MRRRLLVGAGLLLLPFALTASIVLALANDRLPVSSVAEILPQDTVAFCRLPQLGAHLDQATKTQAWKDLKGSLALQGLMHEGRRDLKRFMRDLEERATRLGLEPGLDTYRKFVGHDFGIGVRLDKETGPSMLMVYRIDTPALLQDIAVQNPAALVKIFTERYFPTKKPGSASYGGYEIYQNKRRSFYALIRDMFVASDQKGTIERMIDLANAGGMGSLGKSPKYASEIAKLGEDAIGSIYLDVETLRDPELWKKMAGPDFNADAAFGALQRSVKPFPAVAFGITAPGSDLYHLGLSSSREAGELLTDSGVMDGANLVPTDGFVYLEAQSAVTAAHAFYESLLYKRIRASEWTAKLVKALKQPAKAEEILGMPLGLPRLPEEASAWFETKVAFRTLHGVLSALLPGKVALGVGVPAEDTPMTPTVHAAIELPPILQLAEAFVTAGLAGAPDQGKDVAVKALGNRTQVSFLHQDGHWDEAKQEWVVDRVEPVGGYVRLGNTLFVSTDLKGMETVAQAGAPAETVARYPEVKPGYNFLLHMKYDGFTKLLEEVGGREVQPIVQSLRRSGGDSLTMASYTDDAFLTYELRSWGRFKPEAKGAGARLYELEGKPFTGIWHLLPADTLLSLSWRVDPTVLLDLARETIQAMEQPVEELDGALAEGSKALGVDIEKELLPALGTEMTFAISPQTAPEGSIPVPAITLLWELKNPGVVDKALQAFLGQVVPAPPPDATPRDLARMPKRVDLAAGGVSLHLVEPPARDAKQTGGTLRPGYAILPGVLAISSSGAALETVAKQVPMSSCPYEMRPEVTRALQSVGADKANMVVHVDLAGLMKAIGGYSPFIAQALPAPNPPGLEPPSFPSEGGKEAMEQWQKEFEAYRMQVRMHRKEAAKKNEGKVRMVFDQLAEWLDFFAASGGKGTDGTMWGREVLKLKGR